jgi:phosphoesterase RecJ-like protein
VRKVSLRASDDRVDVSRIARAQGGGGHRRAAGFQTTLPDAELVAFLREQITQQLHAARRPAPGELQRLDTHTLHAR